MGHIYHGIVDLIGRTPLVELDRYEKMIKTKAHILAKLESYNPAGSVKDRAALYMIRGKEKSGELEPGGTIIEGTSGNTGIGLAAVGAAKGYKVEICMPESYSVERRKLLKAYGATLHLTPASEGMKGAVVKAKDLYEQTEGSVIMTQDANENNLISHYEGTGPEIWEDTDGKVDIFIATLGTGGTICGAGKYIKEKNPNVKIIVVEPKNSPVLKGKEPGPHKIQGIGGGTIPAITDVSLFDEIFDVSDEDAFETARLLPKIEGLTIGISAGAALFAAKEISLRSENENKNIVVIIPDSGDRYLSEEDLFD